MAFRVSDYRWQVRKRLTNRLTRRANPASHNLRQDHENTANRRLSNPSEAPHNRRGQNPKVLGEGRSITLTEPQRHGRHIGTPYSPERGLSPLRCSGLCASGSMEVGDDSPGRDLLCSRARAWVCTLRDRFCPQAATDGGCFGPDVVAAMRPFWQSRGDCGLLVSRVIITTAPSFASVVARG